MMPTVEFTKSGISTSRLGFGTSRLHHLHLRKDRQNLLAEAADLGIRHFDTAPAYGDGLAERELGKFLRKRKTECVVATKYGIPPLFLIDAFPGLRLPVGSARAILRRLGIWRTKLPLLSAAGLRRSVHGSLRRLGIEKIDILMLHEATLPRLLEPQELLDELQNLRFRGLIKSFGLAGSFQAILPIVRAHPHLAEIVQTNEASWVAPLIPDITFGAISRGPQSFLSRGIDEDRAKENLRIALGRRPNGAVLISTTNRSHLRALAQIAATASA
jgi:D-threo-aldose 1-dehydrogenase